MLAPLMDQQKMKDLIPSLFYKNCSLCACGGLIWIHDHSYGMYLIYTERLQNNILFEGQESEHKCQADTCIFMIRWVYDSRDLI